MCFAFFERWWFPAVGPCAEPYSLADHWKAELRYIECWIRLLSGWSRTLKDWTTLHGSLNWPPRGWPTPLRVRSPPWACLLMQRPPGPALSAFTFGDSLKYISPTFPFHLSQLTVNMLTYVIHFVSERRVSKLTYWFSSWLTYVHTNFEGNMYFTVKK
jgi:hypothetical protein